MPWTTSLAFSHHGSSFPQMNFAKPLADRFARTVDTETRFLMTLLISLLSGHHKNDNKFASFHTNMSWPPCSEKP